MDKCLSARYVYLHNADKLVQKEKKNQQQQQQQKYRMYVQNECAE